MSLSTRRAETHQRAIFKANWSPAVAAGNTEAMLKTASEKEAAGPYLESARTIENATKSISDAFARVSADETRTDAAKQVELKKFLDRKVKEVSSRLSTLDDDAQKRRQKASANLEAIKKEPAESSGRESLREIRAHLKSLPKGKRLEFIESRIHDEQLVKAVATAPPYLSGLSDNEKSLIVRRYHANFYPEDLRTVEALNKAEEKVKAAYDSFLRTSDKLLPKGVNKISESRQAAEEALKA